MDISGILDYSAGFLIVVGIYAVFSLGLNVHWAYGGMFNIGIAGFFALGAYTSALLTTAPPSARFFEDFKFGGNLPERMGGLDLGIDLWFLVALVAAGFVSGVVAAVVGTIALRLRGDYLPIATLGIAETVRLVFLNEQWLGNGAKGLYRIPRFLGDWVSPRNYDYLYLAAVIVVLAALYVTVEWAIRSPWGRVLKAIRGDEDGAAAGGKNVFAYKLQAFIFGAVIMGIGGALFAHDARFVAPITFDPLLATFMIWAMLMAGGSGNNLGAIVGASLVWTLWTVSQSMPGFISDPDFRFFMIGCLIVAVVVVRPEGLLGERPAAPPSRLD